MRYQTEVYVRGKKTNRIGLVIFIGLILWLSAITVDFVRTMYQYEKPIFTIAKTSDDGGSGIYRGLGYKIDITGNFIPDSDENIEGVVEADFSLLGLHLKHIKRD